MDLTQRAPTALVAVTVLTTALGPWLLFGVDLHRQRPAPRGNLAQGFAVAVAAKGACRR